MGATLMESERRESPGGAARKTTSTKHWRSISHRSAGINPIS
jgi:hypothetical protein